MNILGHKLPALLCHYVENGGINKPIFPQYSVGLTNSLNSKINLHNYDGMWGKTSRFLTEHDRAMLGHPDSDHPPGNLNPQQCVLIGDLGPHQPLALDYRSDSISPSVVTLPWGENPVTDNRWLKITDSFDEFAITLSLINC